MDSPMGTPSGSAFSNTRRQCNLTKIPRSRDTLLYTARPIAGRSAASVIVRRLVVPCGRSVVLRIRLASAIMEKPKDGQIQSLVRWVTSCDTAVGEKMNELFSYASSRAPSMFVGYQAHMALNRFDDFMCFDRNRVVLTDGGHSYIHANEVQLPFVTYVLTQAPLAHTIVDFWRMIWQLKTNVIVSLSEPVSVSERFCPTGESDEHHRCGPLYSIRGNVLAARTNENWRTVEEKLSVKNAQVASIRYIYYKKWDSDKTLPDPEGLLALVREVRAQADEMHEKVCGTKVSKLKKQPPIVAVCPTGAVRCGLLAAADSLTRMIDDPEGSNVDIPSVVKTLRSARYGSIPTLEQYAFLHTLVVENARQKGVLGMEKAKLVMLGAMTKIAEGRPK